MRMLSLAVAVYSLGDCPKTAGAKGEPTPLTPEMTPGPRRLCGTGNFAKETSARASSYEKKKKQLTHSVLETRYYLQH